MNGQIPPEFAQKTAPNRAGTTDAPELSVVSGNGSTGAAGYGYGGYGGYGGGSVAGDSELTFVHYLQILYRRRYLAATAFLAVFLAVSLSAFTAPRIYQGSVRILIERDNPNVVSFKEVLEQNDVSDDYYETQYRILQSRGLARRVIEKLDLWTNAPFAAPARITFRGILMWPVNVVTRWFDPPRPVEAPAAQETRAQTAVLDAFLGNLTVEPVRYSRLVDLKFRSMDPGFAAKVANTSAQEYISQSVEFRSNTTKEASEFLTEQLAEQRKKLEASERALQAYRERTNSVSLEERQNIVVQKLQELNAAVTKANTNRIQKEAAFNQVKVALENPAALDTVPAILGNTFVQQQKAQLADLQRQRAQLAEKLGPNHPDMVKVNVAIQNAEVRLRAEVAQIMQSMRSDYEGAVAEERTLTAALNQQKAEAQTLNRAGIEYGVLERDSTANRQMFEALLQRTQETGVSEQLKTGNIRIVDPAEVPSGPISPNIFNSMVMALLGGLFVAVGLAFTLEYADDRIKNPDELKKYLGLPFLGMIPALFDKKITSPLISAGAPTIFGESFRSIRTNVLFSSTDEGGRLIVVTSSVPGEGKTIVSSNLSVALAQAGHRVLLVDADMRKPRVHDVFSRPVDPGLSNLLVGNATASESIQESPVPGLWLMPAGTHPPNPAELLGSKRFKDFTAFLLQYFDWVIIDTPPVMAVTDAAIPANFAQGVLFVVGAEMTSRRIAQRAVEQLELSQAKFVGAVLNRVDLDHNAYYYSRYYRPDYGGYYGPPGGGSIPHAGIPPQGAAIGPRAARTATAGSRAARIAAAAGGWFGRKATGTVHASVRAAQNFRIERHL
ncbi:MAG: polysaccharide biosynthesis tyrosine autokinase [Acidobacteria bacterium]|nr:polysaccharide biosynthesis tyrosine autokinase [Acidobacteriota bacterium]